MISNTVICERYRIATLHDIIDREKECIKSSTDARFLPPICLRGKLVGKAEALNHLQILSESNQKLKNESISSTETSTQSNFNSKPFSINTNVGAFCFNELEKFTDQIHQSLTYSPLGFYWIDCTGVIYCKILNFNCEMFNKDLLVIEWTLVECVSTSNGRFLCLEISECVPTDCYDSFFSKINYSHSNTFSSLESKEALTVSEYQLNDNSVSITGTVVGKSCLVQTKTNCRFFAELKCPLISKVNGKHQEKMLTAWIVYNNGQERQELVKCYHSIHVGCKYDFKNLKPAQISVPETVKKQKGPKVASYMVRKALRYSVGQSSFVKIDDGLQDGLFLYTEINDFIDSMLDSDLDPIEAIASFRELKVTQKLNQDLVILNEKYKMHVLTHLLDDYGVSLREGAVIDVHNVHIVKFNQCIHLGMCEYSGLRYVKFSKEKSSIFQAKRKFKGKSLFDVAVAEYLEEEIKSMIGSSNKYAVDQLLGCLGFTSYSPCQSSVNHWECDLGIPRYSVPKFTSISHLLTEANKKFNNEHCQLIPSQILIKNCFLICTVQLDDIGSLSLKDSSGQLPFLFLRDNLEHVIRPNSIIIATNFIFIRENVGDRHYLVLNSQGSNSFLISPMIPNRIIHALTTATRSQSIVPSSVSTSATNSALSSNEDGILCVIGNFGLKRVEMAHDLDHPVFTVIMEGIGYDATRASNHVIRMQVPQLIHCKFIGKASIAANVFKSGDIIWLKQFSLRSSAVLDICNLEDCELVHVSIETFEQSNETTLLIGKNPNFVDLWFSRENFICANHMTYFTCQSVNDLLTDSSHSYDVTGYSTRLHSVVGIISIKRYQPIDVIHSDPVDIELYHKYQSHLGPSNAIVVTVTGTTLPLSLDIYMDLRTSEWPKGLVEGAVVEFRQISVKKIKKSNSFYGYFKSASSYTILSVSPETTTTTGIASEPSKASCLVASSKPSIYLNSAPFSRSSASPTSSQHLFLSMFHTCKHLEYVKSNQAVEFIGCINYVSQVRLWVECVNCKQSSNLCVCSAETCDFSISGRAEFSFEDGSSEALIILQSTDDIWKLIHVDLFPEFKSKIVSHVTKNGSLIFNNDKKFTNSETSVTNVSQHQLLNDHIDLSFQVMCSRSCLNRRIRIEFIKTASSFDGESVTSLQLNLNRIKERKFTSYGQGQLTTLSNTRLVIHSQKISECTYNTFMHLYSNNSN